jgi:hypothetical protein
MSHRYETFGWRDADVDHVAERVGRALSIELEPRSSLYRGEYYRWRGAGASDIILQENFVEEDDGLRTDDEFPEHAVLLYASSLPGTWFDRIAAIEGVEKLSSPGGP